MTEPRLIDAHDLWTEIMMLPHNGDMISSEEVEKAIVEAPAVDAVPVVRCKDCLKRNTADCPMSDAFESYPFYDTKDDDFCSYGERREGE